MIMLLLLVAQRRRRSKRTGLGWLTWVLRIGKVHFLALVCVNSRLIVIVCGCCSAASVVRTCLEASRAICPSLLPIIGVLGTSHELLSDQRVGVDFCSTGVVLTRFSCMLICLWLSLHNVVAVKSL